MMAFMDIGLKFSYIHERLAIEMNSCLQETNIPEWIRKNDLDPKRPRKYELLLTTTDP